MFSPVYVRLSPRTSPLNALLQAETFKNSANTTITTVEQAVGDDENIDLEELKNARDLLGDAQEDLELAESETRDATDSFNGVIIFVGVCAIICAILGLLCVFVRVRVPNSTCLCATY